MEPRLRRGGSISLGLQSSIQHGINRMPRSAQKLYLAIYCGITVQSMAPERICDAVWPSLAMSSSGSLSTSSSGHQ
jgi:hypothetical protein